MLKDTYVDMAIALPQYGEGPDFSKVKKRLRDTNGFLIGRDHDNPMLDKRVNEVGYLDGHKASLAVNTIAENIFSTVGEEVNIFMIFDEIVGYCLDVKYNMQKDASIVSNIGGKRIRETT